MDYSHPVSGVENDLLLRLVGEIRHSHAVTSVGTKRTSGDVCYLVANGGKADIAFGSKAEYICS